LVWSDLTPNECAHFCAHRASKWVIIWGVWIVNGAEEERGKLKQRGELIATRSSRDEDDVHGC
jgi:hypothetical protein